MKKEFRISLLLLSLFAVVSTTAHSFSLVTKSANNASFRITASSYAVNYYVPSAEGDGFVLDSTEYVAPNGTLTNIPSVSVANFTFEKWSTSSSLSDSFNTSGAITDNIDLYAACYGYYVKGSSDENYTLVNYYGTSSQWMPRLDKTNNGDSKTYTYALLGTDVGNGKIASTRLKGSTIASYKRYLGTNTYTQNASKSSLTNDGYYKVFLNPTAGVEGNKLFFLKTFIVELKNCSDSTYAYVWNAAETKGNSWPGLAMTYLGRGQGGDSYKRYWSFDIDVNVVNKVIANNNNNGKQTADLTLPSDSTNNTYYCDNYTYDTGWYTLDLNTTLDA